MKVWATSDLHIDFPENWHWFNNLSSWDYQDDLLILAGDITHDLQSMQKLLRSLRGKFSEVFFVPGNHDLWLWKGDAENSFDKFEKVMALTKEEGIQTSPYTSSDLAIVPLLAWYDFSFGLPSENLKQKWNDFRNCRWPHSLPEVNQFFLDQNVPHLNIRRPTVISFSHFLPFVELIPSRVPEYVKQMLPVFGSHQLGEQVQKLKPTIHMYGHSHLNRQVLKSKTRYVNNAFGYPKEEAICRKQLLCIYE